MDYKGTIIKESLENKDVLEKLEIISTRVEAVNKDHQTPWLKQWTLHKVIVSSVKADAIAKELATALDREHGGSWYADYKNDKNHFIIFPNRVFKIDRSRVDQYKAATDYGLKLGIPNYQVDFMKDLII